MAQQPPRVPLDGFPAHRGAAPTRRCSGPTRPAWGRGGSAATAADGSTCPPRGGTCYVATSAVAARARAARGGPRRRRHASRPRCSRAWSSRGCASRAARAWPTSRCRGPPTSASPASSRRWSRTTVPQAWARAFAAVDLEGVRYAPALHDRAGARRGAVRRMPATPAGRSTPHRSPAADVPGAPLAMPAPRRMDLTVVRPPRRRIFFSDTLRGEAVLARCMFAITPTTGRFIGWLSLPARRSANASSSRPSASSRIGRGVAKLKRSQVLPPGPNCSPGLAKIRARFATRPRRLRASDRYRKNRPRPDRCRRDASSARRALRLQFARRTDRGSSAR